MRLLRSRRSPIACVLLLLYLPACTSTHVVAAPSPAQLVETARPPSIRVTSTAGTTYTLASPLVSGDSLVGVGVGARDAGRVTSLAWGDISSISIEKPAAMSWKIGTPTPAQFVEADHPQSIRVTRSDGTTLTLKSPVVRGDSLVASVSSESVAPSTGVVLSDVGSVAVTKAAPGKTVLLLLVAATAIGVIVALNSCPGPAC